MRTPRAKRVVVAIGVIALLLIGGLTVWSGMTGEAPTTSPTSDGLPPSPITQPTSTPPTTAASAASDGECSSTDTTAGVGDASLPADLRWHNGETASWPVSDMAGPTGERDGLPACFASSADGAVLAAVTFLFEQTERSPLQTFPTYVANTPGKEIAIRSLNGHSDGEIQEVMRTSGVETVGYRVDAWTAEQASVTIALRAPDSDAVSGWPVELMRVGGDWLVRLRPDGTVGDPSLLEASDFREWPR